MKTVVRQYANAMDEAYQAERHLRMVWEGLVTPVKKPASLKHGDQGRDRSVSVVHRGLPPPPH